MESFLLLSGFVQLYCTCIVRSSNVRFESSPQLPRLSNNVHAVSFCEEWSIQYMLRVYNSIPDDHLIPATTDRECWSYPVVDRNFFAKLLWEMQR